MRQLEGPVGADGQRPILSAWASKFAPAAARAAGTPTSPATSRTAAATGGGQAGGGGSAPTSGGGGGVPAPVTPTVAGEGDKHEEDADGWTTYHRRGRRNAATAQPMQVSEAQGSNPSAETDEDTRRDRDSWDSWGDDGRWWSYGGDWWSGDGGGDEIEAEGQQEADPEVLKAAWQQDLRLLTWLKAQGYPEDHPSRLHAEEQCEESKRLWQDSKEPTPPYRRLQWAEKALLRARKAQSRAEQELDDFDRWYEEVR